MNVVYQKTKTCSKCKEEKPVGCFAKRLNGLQHMCRPCTKQYRTENKDHIKERNRRYLREHREEQNEKNRRWRRENPEKYREQIRRHREKHGEKLFARNRWYHEQVMREALIEYGGKCRLCGDVRLWTLTLAHINDDGALYRKSGGKTGAAFAKFLKVNGFPKDLGIGVECYNCNCSASGKYSWRRVERDRWLKENGK